MDEIVRTADGVKHLVDGKVVSEARVDRASRTAIEIRHRDFSGARDEGAGDPLQLFLDSKESDYRRRADRALVCSFCQKANHEVRKLIAGPGSYICDECVKLCSEIIAEQG